MGWTRHVQNDSVGSDSLVSNYQLSQQAALSLLVFICSRNKITRFLFLHNFCTFVFYTSFIGGRDYAKRKENDYCRDFIGFGVDGRELGLYRYPPELTKICQTRCYSIEIVEKFASGGKMCEVKRRK